MICCAGDTPALSPHALRSCDRPKVLEVLENSTKIRTPISVKCLCNTRQPEHMQSFTDGLSRLGGGVMDSLFGPKNEQQETLQQEGLSHRNIEYVDEISSNLYPDLHFSEIIGSHKGKPGPDDDDFLILESSEVPKPTCSYFYIPFSQSVDMCNILVRHWLDRIWFLPADWKTALRVLPGRACLVPFFVFDVRTHSTIMAEIQIDTLEGLQWQHKSEDINNQYNQFIVCASCTVNQKLIHKLLYSEEHGFSFHSNLALPPQLSPYPPANNDAVTIICGENILPIDITKTEAWEVSVKYKIDEEELRKGSEKMSENNAAYDVHATRDLTITTEYFDVHTVVYLPIYFSSFDYNGQIYEVLVSGNKGVVVGNERPIGTGAGGKFLMDKLKSLSNLVSDTVPM